MTSTQAPGKSFSASAAAIHPGRTQACTKRTDNGAYLHRSGWVEVAMWGAGEGVGVGGVGVCVGGGEGEQGRGVNVLLVYGQVHDIRRGWR